MKLHLLRPPGRPFPVATGTRDGVPYEHMTPRLGSIRLLREKIADRRAGLDPYDPSSFLVDASPVEAAGVQRALERTGALLYSAPHGAGVRFRALLEADVRAELGLNAEGAPTLDDEPLASRGLRVLTLADGRLADENLTAAILDSASPEQLAAIAGGRRERPRDRAAAQARLADQGPLRSEDSPVLRFLDEAKAAYDRRYPNGVFDQEVQ